MLKPPLVRSLSLWDSSRSNEERTWSDSFIFPNFIGYDAFTQDFIRRDMMALDHIKHLEEKQNDRPPIINWSPSLLSRLIPIKIEGDGNCLLHAVSVGMWGIHDRDYTLRKKLNEILCSDISEKFCERWRYANMLQDTPKEIWLPRWSELLTQTTVSVSKNQFGKSEFNYLEQLHIFVLSNVLKRPIIVYADDRVMNEHGKVVHIAKGVEKMSGIFLPLAFSPDECDKNPLALTFYSSHFSSLIAEDSVPFPILDLSKPPAASNNDNNNDKGITEINGFSVVTPQPIMKETFLIYDDFTDTNNPNISDTGMEQEKAEEKRTEMNGKHEIIPEPVVGYFPICDINKELFEVHMLLPDEKKDISLLLNKYCNIEKSDNNNITYAVQYSVGRTPFIVNTFHKYLYSSQTTIEHSRNQMITESLIQKMNCVAGCGFMGRSDQQGMCSKCYKISKGFSIDAKTTTTTTNSSSSSNDRKPCLGGCGFYGLASNGYYCSQCLRDFPASGSVIIPNNNTNNITPSSSPSTVIPSIISCHNSCGFAGSSVTMGFCSSCYKARKDKIQAASMYWDTISENEMYGPCLLGCDFSAQRPNKMCSVCFAKTQKQK